MDGFVAWVDQVIDNLRLGVDKGIVLPKVVVERDPAAAGGDRGRGPAAERVLAADPEFSGGPLGRRPPAGSPTTTTRVLGEAGAAGVSAPARLPAAGVSAARARAVRAGRSCLPAMSGTRTWCGSTRRRSARRPRCTSSVSPRWRGLRVRWSGSPASSVTRATCAVFSMRCAPIRVSGPSDPRPCSTVMARCATA